MLVKYLIFFTSLFQLSLEQGCRKSITKASGSRAPNGPYCSGAKIFEDNFNNLNCGKWNHENSLSGGNNWEFQWYTDDPENSYTSNGKLHIRPTLTSAKFGEGFLSSGEANIPNHKCTDARSWGCYRKGTSTHIINPIRSARLQTKDSFNFKYGTLEVRAKLPSGDWLWPAVWLLPKRKVYGEWPASGEIELLESRGNRNLYQNGKNIGTKQCSATLQFGPEPKFNGWEHAHKSKNHPNGFDKNFHVYKFTWTPKYFKYYIDGREYGTIDSGNGFFEKGRFPPNVHNPWSGSSKMAPFDQEFYIILNLAVGGVNGYFSDSAQNLNSKPWSNQSPKALTDFWDGRKSWLPTWGPQSTFQIDYVRVFAL